MLTTPSSKSLSQFSITRSQGQSQNQGKIYVTTDGQSASLSWNKAPIWGLRPDIYDCLTITVLFYGAPSLMRGRICLLYMLLALASAVRLEFQALWSRDHILLPQI
jgi:hypothetical protein